MSCALKLAILCINKWKNVVVVDGERREKKGGVEKEVSPTYYTYVGQSATNERNPLARRTGGEGIN